MIDIVDFYLTQTVFQVEFASPKELLAKEKGFFKALVDESGDKDRFYEVAEKKGRSLTA
jgi:hypothetical protein